MKKRLFLFCCLIFIAKLIIGQDLIPDGTFENNYDCPMDVISLPLLEWISPTAGTPNYFHECGTTTTGAPVNFSGFEHPYSDSAYCGIIIKNSGNNPNTVNFREYIQTQLKAPLIPGSLYHLSFYVSLGELSQLGSDAIGALFSTYPISRNDHFAFTQIPQVINPPGNFITDQDGWTLITESFIADSAYTHITIGNFLDDFNTPTIPADEGLIAQSYFYIDNVSLTFITDLQAAEYQSAIEIFPNPVLDVLYVTTVEEGFTVLQLFDITGRKVFQTNLKDKFNTVYINQIPPGVYCFKIKRETELLRTGLLMKNE